MQKNNPDLIFLSEPKLFQCDLKQVMQYFEGEYCSFLNSDDLYDPELPLISSNSFGGTMVLWKNHLDPFISTQRQYSSGFLPIIFCAPNLQASIHISLYLPTAGKDAHFLDVLAQLQICIDDLLSKLPDAVLFLRGDCNVNCNNSNRLAVFKHFCNVHNFEQVTINHPTYHHFMGQGTQDSNLDILLYSKSNSSSTHGEELLDICCKLENPLLQSHHDALISVAKIPVVPDQPKETDLLTAPRIPNDRRKVNWSAQGISDYKDLLSLNLPKLRENWLKTDSKSSISILLNSTNQLMTKAEAATNDILHLNKKFEKRSKKLPYKIRKSKNIVLKSFKSCKNKPVSQSHHKKTLLNHRKLIREAQNEQNCKRDENLHKILSSNPSSLFRTIRSEKMKSKAATNILQVNDKLYEDEKVPDGFFDTLSQLKTTDPDFLSQSESYIRFCEDHKHIIKICEDRHDIPAISLKKSSEILKRIKPTVIDFFSISAQHYANAGTEGHFHFNQLLNSIIADLNNIDVFELNAVYALFLHKGHCKDKSSSRSYRTISTCPLLSKALDLYIRDLYLECWNQEQADTQFQGEGRSHELAALLLSETIQVSLNFLSEPIFLLYLDAKSAFDKVLRQILIRNLYDSGVQGAATIFIDERLKTDKLSVSGTMS